MTTRNIIKFAAAAAAGALALGSLAHSTALAAPSSTTGLYGASDPTYDGVFRQSLAILGLTSVGVKPSAPAIDWLLNQQCADGSYQAYRTDLAAPARPATRRHPPAPTPTRPGPRSPRSWRSTKQARRRRPR